MVLNWGTRFAAVLSASLLGVTFGSTAFAAGGLSTPAATVIVENPGTYSGASDLRIGLTASSEQSAVPNPSCRAEDHTLRCSGSLMLIVPERGGMTVTSFQVHRVAVGNTSCGGDEGDSCDDSEAQPAATEPVSSQAVRAQVNGRGVLSVPGDTGFAAGTAVQVKMALIDNGSAQYEDVADVQVNLFVEGSKKPLIYESGPQLVEQVDVFVTTGLPLVPTTTETPTTTSTPTSTPGTSTTTISAPTPRLLPHGIDTVTPATTTTVPLPAFPGAAESYPNGAIVRFSGSYYVLAGGRAFPVPSAQLKTFSGAQVVPVDAPAGAEPPTDAPLRPGTLLVSRGSSHDRAVYVVGTDGRLYGFASPAQFQKLGFDRALVVRVPSLAGLAVSSTSAAGAHVDALSTRSDGAIVVSRGTYFVFGGGRAFSVPDAAALAALQKADVAQPLTGTVGPAVAPLADGVVLSVRNVGVCVTYHGRLFPYRSMTQLLTEGYGGTAAVSVPGLGGLRLVQQYSGW